MFEAIRRMIQVQKAPLLTYVIPNYGYDHLIGDWLASLVGQTRKDWCAIIVHQGPEDLILPVLARFDDPRITVLPLPGPVSTFKARRLGFEAVTTSFVAHIDADDMVTPCHAEHLLEAATRTGADIVVGDVEFQQPNGEVKAGELHTTWQAPLSGTGLEAAEFMRDWGRSVLWDAIYRTEAVREAYAEIPSDMAVTYAEDTVLRMTLWTRDVSFVRVKELVYRHRLNPESVTRRKSWDDAMARWRDARRSFAYLYDSFRADPRRMAEMPWLLHKVVGGYQGSVFGQVWTVAGLGEIPKEAFATLSRDFDFELADTAASFRRRERDQADLTRARARNQKLTERIKRLEEKLAKLETRRSAPGED